MKYELDWAKGRENLLWTGDVWIYLSNVRFSDRQTDGQLITRAPALTKLAEINQIMHPKILNTSHPVYIDSYYMYICFSWR